MKRALYDAVVMPVVRVHEGVRRRVSLAVCNWLGITYAFGQVRAQLDANNANMTSVAKQLNANTLVLARWASESAVLSSIEERHRKRQATLAAIAREDGNHAER